MTIPEGPQRADLQLSRRSLFLACASMAATVATGCQPEPFPAAPTRQPVLGPTPVTPTIDRPLLSALHVHASFSEGGGSMAAQLTQAQKLGYEAVWWTEHDWRMASHGYLSHLTVDGPSTEDLTWRQGEDSVGEHRFGHDLPHTNAAGPTAAVWLRVEGSSARGEHRLVASSERHLYRTSLHGQTWTVMVHPENLEAGFLGLDLRTSWRPGTGGREEGFYRISYRFGSAGSSLEVNGRRAQFRLQAPIGEWTELTLRPADDLISAWPDIDGGDASCIEVSLIAEAPPGGSAAGFLSGITIDRSAVEGDEPLVAHREVMRGYTGDYPSITQLQGLEISGANPHICWYGGTPRIPPATAGPPTLMVSEVKAGGGVASYTHPFGVGSQPPDSPPQISMAAPVLQAMLTDGIRECDAVEVGYRHRGGATLAIHESLWDALSRRGVFLTGLGVNDDHVGRGWTETPNNFGSWLWAPSTEEEDLVAAMRSGHVYFGDPTLFSGQLDILPAAGGRMGKAVVVPGSTSEVRLLASGLPVGSHLELLQLSMSLGAEPADPAAAVISSTSAADVLSGVVTTTIATAEDCLVRTRVRDDLREVIALSNPVWFVRDESTYPIPEHRRATTN